MSADPAGTSAEAPPTVRVAADLHGLRAVVRSLPGPRTVRRIVALVLALAAALGWLAAGSGPLHLGPTVVWLLGTSFSVFAAVLLADGRKLELDLRGSQMTWRYSLLGLPLGSERRVDLPGRRVVRPEVDRVELHDESGVVAAWSVDETASEWLAAQLEAAAALESTASAPPPAELRRLVTRERDRE